MPLVPVRNRWPPSHGAHLGERNELRITRESLRCWLMMAESVSAGWGDTEGSLL
jgi:hypothetical protein